MANRHYDLIEVPGFVYLLNEHDAPFARAAVSASLPSEVRFSPLNRKGQKLHRVILAIEKCGWNMSIRYPGVDMPEKENFRINFNYNRGPRTSLVDAAKRPGIILPPQVKK